MNVKEVIRDKKAKVAAGVTAAVVGAGAALPQIALAEGETGGSGSASVATQMGTLAAQVQTDAMSTITNVLPAIIGVVGIGVVVGIGIKWVRKMRAS